MRLLSLSANQKLSLREMLMKQVEEAMQKVDVTTKINLTYSVTDLFKLQAVQAKPIIRFTLLAWTKLRMLTLSQTTEVACHGLVKKIVDPDPKEAPMYLINDILVYPQEVNAGHVESVDAEYGPWMNTLPDEVFNAVRMQYHSHAGFGVEPSAQDLQHQESMIPVINDFYIFMIGNNKELEFKIWLYDKEPGIIYEREDLVIQIGGMGGWLNENKHFIKKHVYIAPPVTTPPARETYGYGYNGQQYAVPPVPAQKKTGKTNGKKQTQETDEEAILNKYLEGMARQEWERSEGRAHYESR